MAGSSKMTDACGGAVRRVDSMNISEEALAGKIVGKLFLIPPQDVDCEFCGNVQKVPIPTKVDRVDPGWIRGEGGSMIYACESCGGPAEVTWDAVNLQITQFFKG